MAVNSSFGVPGGGRFDSADPINQATKRLHAGGGDGGVLQRQLGLELRGGQPAGRLRLLARRRPTGRCKTNPYSVAPWVMSAAGARKDARRASRRAAPLLLLRSRRPRPPDGAERRDDRLLTHPHRPGHQRALGRATRAGTPRRWRSPASRAPCRRRPAARASTASTSPSPGTSMAAPAVTGAVAVVQSAARARLGRLLTPAEVEGVMTASARPMTGIDGFWDFPCGSSVRVRQRHSAGGLHGRSPTSSGRWAPDTSMCPRPWRRCGRCRPPPAPAAGRRVCAPRIRDAWTAPPRAPT